MHRRLRITIGQASLSATLNHSPQAAGLWDLLPLHGEVRMQPGEVVLALTRTPSAQPALLTSQGDRRKELGIGELVYRDELPALSVFYDATPHSLAGEPRAETEVSVVGMLEQEPTALAGIRAGDAFVLEGYEV